MIRDDQSIFFLTFDESESTSVKARTAEEAVSLGKQFSQNGRTNVRIATPGAKSFALAEFEAALARREETMSNNSAVEQPSPGLQLLLHRASTVRFAEPGPTRDQVEILLTAAVTAADHGRIRPWRFIVMQGSGRERLGELLAEHVRADKPDASEQELENARAKALRAPLVIALVCKPEVGHKVPVIEQHSAAAAAGAQLMLAANALGFGAAWKTGGAAYHPVVRSGLGLGDNDTIIGFFYVGSDSQPSPLRRATIESVVQYWPA